LPWHIGALHFDFSGSSFFFGSLDALTVFQ